MYYNKLNTKIKLARRELPHPSPQTNNVFAKIWTPIFSNYCLIPPPPQLKTWASLRLENDKNRYISKISWETRSFFEPKWAQPPAPPDKAEHLPPFSP